MSPVLSRRPSSDAAQDALRAGTRYLFDPDAVRQELDKNVMPADTSSMATVVVTPEALGQAERLPVPIRGRIHRILLRLANWPEVSGAKPLSGELAGRYRIRTGDYRLQFRVEGDRVVVEKIGHRSGFYDQ
jgi:mRNA-degrading endonuclease RelE of RelBE toxin-antitoxin system